MNLYNKDFPIFSVASGQNYEHLESIPYVFGLKLSECRVGLLFCLLSLALKDVLILPGSCLEELGISLSDLLEREVLLVVLEETSQFEVVLCVQVALHSHVVLDQLKELLLEFVDFFSDEEGIDECEVGI